MPRTRIRFVMAAPAIAVMAAAVIGAGCGRVSQTQGTALAPQAGAVRAYVEKFGWHPTGEPDVSQVTVPAIQPGSHDDVSNVLLADAGLDLAAFVGQAVDVYNLRLTDQREGNLKGLPLHAVVWIQKEQVVAAWILPQGDTGDPARDTYRGGFYSIKGRTLEEVTGLGFQTWRQNRVQFSSPDPTDTSKAPPSPVTWAISSLDEPWMQAPMSVRLMLPQRFRLTFSAPVDRASVEQALRRDLAAYSTEAAWQDDQTLDFTVKSGPATERYTFLRLSAAGALDRSGLMLQSTETRNGPAEFLLGVGQQSEVWRWTHGDGPRLAAALPGAFDVLSVSPDGSRLVLRLYGIESAGGWPPVGPPPGFAYLYDIPTGKLARLQGVSGWLSPQWLADGSLLISGSFQGTDLMWVTPDGAQNPLVQGLTVVDYAVSPDGKQIAAFVLNDTGLEAKGDLWLIHLDSGKRQEFKGVYTPSRTPNGVPFVAALWSPDGGVLAFADRTTDQLEGVYRVVAFEPATAKFFTLIAEVGEPRAWSPDGKYLFIADTGTLDVEKRKIVLPKHPDRFTFFAGFSPKGDRVYVDGLGLLTVPSWQPAGEVPGGYRIIHWAPDGSRVGLANNSAAGSHSDPGWAVDRADGTEVWSRKALFPNASVGADSPWVRFLWSPDSRFVAIPGVGVGDLADEEMHPLGSGLGTPIGWNRSGALFLSPNTQPFDAEYVKPTQFRR